MSNAKRQRADLLLVSNGLCTSRTQAKTAILAGQVRVGDDHVVRSPAELITVTAPLHIVHPFPYVSRGAEKLRPSLDRHCPDLAGKVVLDLGASTGGFTDLMLQRGAIRAYAIDVGHGQLHYRLRRDPRVICREGVNARYLSANDVPEPVDIITADLSFISVMKVLPAAIPFATPGAFAFILVKPQFEADRGDVGKGGVVRDPARREQIVTAVCTTIRDRIGWRQLDVSASPLPGAKGNVESIAVFRAPG